MWCLVPRARFGLALAVFVFALCISQGQGDAPARCGRQQLRAALVLRMWLFALWASRGVGRKDWKQVDGVEGAACACCVEKQMPLASRGEGLKLWWGPLGPCLVSRCGSKSISRACFQRAVMLLNLSQHPLVRFGFFLSFFFFPSLVCTGLENLLRPARWLLPVWLGAGCWLCALLGLLLTGSKGSPSESVIPTASAACRGAASPSLISQNPFPAQVHPAWWGRGFPFEPPREEDAV